MAAGKEATICRLVQHASGVEEAGLCTVRPDACTACCASFAPSAQEPNPIVASLLFSLAGQILEQGGVAGCPVDKAAFLQAWSRPHLDAADDHVIWVTKSLSRRFPARTGVADVILYCADASHETARAAESILRQEQAVAILHLVAPEGANGILQHFVDQPNVVCHRGLKVSNVFEAMHELTPFLRSEYVAVQDARSLSHRHRIRNAVEYLSRTGGDLLATALKTPGGIIRPQEPGNAFQRYFPPQTLVFRRAALIDLGGFAERREGLDAELVFRMHQERRPMTLSLDPTVSCLRPWVSEAVGPAPHYVPRDGLLRHHARGFCEETVACDVVLPFHGHLDYLQQALQSVLEQEGTDVVIHLVDDASPEDTGALLRYWGSHPRVRTYRNVRNLGQFVSFNNVVPFLETRLAAVQDADDISLPQRLRRAGNALRLADADLFGGRTLVFHGASPMEGQGVFPWRRSRYRYSRTPVRALGYFLENPTAMMRISTFEDLGGFADFGTLLRNRCSLDTEFHLRAHYSGRRFAISREVVTCYRRHPDSAMQNPLTGWGSPARSWSETEVVRRVRVFRRGAFDPRAFGGLRAYWGQTQRLN
jgi:hypothetical protein